jgi:enoyl-CoA hydratase
MTYENILLEEREAGIRVLTVNRPRQLNALNPATVAEIGRAVAEVGADASARVLLVTGAGDKAFVAGADISAMKDFGPIEAKALSDAALDAFHAIERLPLPTIAVVNGYALGGGCELALACDWIVASDRATFGQPEVNLGIPPGFGGTQRLPRRIGHSRAMELLTTGRQVKADEAERWGLANHVYPHAELIDRALEFARLVASKSPLGVRYAKQAAVRGQDVDLVAGLRLEGDLFALAFASADQKEGMAAFVEKRLPKFTDR